MRNRFTAEWQNATESDSVLSLVRKAPLGKRGGLKFAGKRHFLATQLFQCCTAVFHLLQRSSWSK